MSCEHTDDPYFCLRCPYERCLLTESDEIDNDPAIKKRYMKRDYIKHKVVKEKIRPSDEDMRLVRAGQMSYRTAYQRAYRKVMPPQQKAIYNAQQREYAKTQRMVLA